MVNVFSRAVSFFLCLAMIGPAFAHNETSGVMMEITVLGSKPQTAASSQVMRDRDFQLRSMIHPTDILKVTPGLYTGQHAGGGKANQYFLRGFDADHGTDIALWVDGMPVNNVSHAHGQGYADLHFVIPELIEKVEVHKGPYFVEYGDFATAGAVRLDTRKIFTENMMSFTVGSFDTYRYFNVVTSKESPFKPTLAAEIYSSNGPFDNPERLKRYNLFFRSSFVETSRSSLALTLMSYGSGWNGSGQIPLREVEAGRLDRFGSIDPSEGGNSQRHSASLSYASKPRDGDEWKASAYLIHYRLALFSNFTFFANDPVNGDQIEQDDQRATAGFQSTYRIERDALGKTWATVFGVQARNDSVHTELNNTVNRQRLSQVVDADIREGSLAAYLQEEVTPITWLRLIGGVRADYYGFDVEDHLQVLPAAATTGTAQDYIVSPKGNAILTPKENWDIYLNYGEGFHSNDARGVVQVVDPVTPLTKARGYEAGSRVKVWDRWDVAFALWRLDLDNEIVWVGDAGTTEPRGKTKRYGIDGEIRYAVLDGLWADLDITHSKARFVSNAGNGDAVALAPTLTISGGLVVKHPSGFFGSFRVEHLDDRPATEDESLTAEGFTVFNLTSGFSRGSWEVRLDIPNLFNENWREAQFANDSRLVFEPSPVTDIHFVPGAPRSYLGTVRYYF
jgi:outer membrane receptor protein involved in Fe transport